MYQSLNCRTSINRSRPLKARFPQQIRRNHLQSPGSLSHRKHAGGSFPPFREIPPACDGCQPIQQTALGRGPARFDARGLPCRWHAPLHGCRGAFCSWPLPGQDCPLLISARHTAISEIRDTGMTNFRKISLAVLAFGLLFLAGHSASALTNQDIAGVYQGTSGRNHVERGHDHRQSHDYFSSRRGNIKTVATVNGQTVNAKGKISVRERTRHQ